MSWKATAAVKPLTHGAYGEPLTAREKLLLFVLADYHNDNRHVAWASLAAIARASLTSRKHTITLLKRLVAHGLIAIEHRQQKTNLYRLLFVGDHPKPPGGTKGRPKADSDEGGGEVTSPSTSEVDSPGVVISRGNQASHPTGSPEPLFSRQESNTAPDRRSQDTVTTPSVEKLERQFSADPENLAKEKPLPRYTRPTDPLRAEIWDAMYFDKIEKVFLDGHRLSFRERVLDCIEVATTLAVTGRCAKLKVLRADDIEILAANKLKSRLEHLRQAADLLADNPSFVRIVAEHVRKAVTDAAAELLESHMVSLPKLSAKALRQLAG